jgi:hypothetical protein
MLERIGTPSATNGSPVKPVQVRAPASKSGGAAWGGTPFGIKFYYTDQAALLVDPPRPGSGTVPPYPGYDPITNPGPAIAILRTRATAFIDELRQSYLNSGGLFHVMPFQAGDVTRLLALDGEPFPEFSGGDPGLRFGNYLEVFRLVDKVSGGRASSDADLAVLLLADVGNPGAPLYGASRRQRPDCGEFAGPPTLELCGQGVLPPPLLPGQQSYRDWGQAVVSINPGSAGLTFSHEVGHMLGNDHDLPNANALPDQSFAHSFGYRIAFFRDIMADPPCNLDICPRGWQYSNPFAFIIGTGLPAGTALTPPCPDRDTCPAQSHAALTIRKLAAGVSNIYPLSAALVEPDLHWDGFEF